MKRSTKSAVSALVVFGLALLVASSALAKGNGGKSGSGSYCGSSSHCCHDYCYNNCYHNSCCYDYCTPCNDYCYPTTCCEPVVVEQPVCEPVCQPVCSYPTYCSSNYCYPSYNSCHSDSCHVNFKMSKGMKK